MGRRSKSEVPDSIVDGIETTQPVSYNIEQPTENVLLQSRFPARIKQTGQVTGKVYVWEKAGSIVEVDAQDVDNLLAKKIGGQACCGSKNNNYLFTRI